MHNAAPVSHQKQPDRNATNATEIKQNRSKINEADRYPAAHNGQVAGSNPAAGPFTTSLPMTPNLVDINRGRSRLLALRSTAPYLDVSAGRSARYVF
jgi:hypothetical protein